MAKELGISRPSLDAYLSLPGAPTADEHGYDLSLATNELGRHWEFMRTSIKLYPVCHQSHAFMNAAKKLGHAHTIAPDQVERIGGVDREIRVALDADRLLALGITAGDVNRQIRATNIDLETALREGKLREDLYFRINTITLVVPPLRERIEDVPALCEHLITTFNARYGRQVQAISSAALDLLLRRRGSGKTVEGA